MILVYIQICLVGHLTSCYGSSVGSNTSQTVPRVLRGKEAAPHTYPSLIYSETSGGGDGVLAVLLHPAWILTSGQVANDAKVLNFKAGRHNVANQTESDGSQTSAGVAHLHPGFDGDYKDNLGLFRLDKPYELNEKVQPVPVATDSFSLPDKATIVGWGGINLTDPGDFSDVLLEADAPIVPNPVCEQIWKAENVTNVVSESSVCCGELNGSNACFGDLDGPLYAKVSEGGKSQQVLLGTVSHEGCWSRDSKKFNMFGLVTVYTRVSKYIDWIQNVTGLQYEPQGDTGYGYFKGSIGSSGNNNNGLSSQSQKTTRAVLKLASRLAENICSQVEGYSLNKNVSPPVKKSPAAASRKIKCGLFQMQKCETSSCLPFQSFKC